VDEIASGIMINAAQWLFVVVVWGACFAAMARAARMIGSADEIGVSFKKELQSAGRIAAGLGSVQLMVLLMGYWHPQWSWAKDFAWGYLAGSVALPFLWGCGKADAARLNWPWQPGGNFLRKCAVAGGIILILSALTLTLLRFSGATEGATVKAAESRAPSDLAAALMIGYLILNGPWLEELVFRHCLLPWLARWWGGGRIATVAAVVVTSVVFAGGHAGHVDPAWPKLLQVTAWGLVLAWARVAWGSGWAIGLHLAWNLISPVVALLWRA